MPARTFSTMSQLGIIIFLAAAVVLLNASSSTSFVVPSLVSSHHNKYEIRSSSSSSSSSSLSNDLRRRERQQQRFSLLLSSENEIDSNNENVHAPRAGSMAELYKETGKVPYGEDSRQYRRTVFLRSSDWSRHRSPDRLFSNLRYLYRSGIARQLKLGVKYVSTMAFITVLWNDIILNPSLCTSIPLLKYLPKLGLPSLPFTLSSSALGLLLVFRTNASYQRWLEGQNNIVKIVSELKNILRMTSTWLPPQTPPESESESESDKDEGELIIKNIGLKCWTVLRTLQCHLRNTSEEETSFSIHIRKTLGKLDDDNDNDNDEGSTVNKLLKSKDRPFWAINDLSALVQTLANHPYNIDGGRLREMDKSISSITSSVELCTKCIRYPVPLVYTRHTARFLSLWLLLLPLALYDSFDSTSILSRLLLIPTSSLISLFFFGIDELAIQLEEPFGILPLEYNCANMKLISKQALLWYTKK